jgi:molybdate transport system substrate-binding protein
MAIPRKSLSILLAVISNLLFGRSLEAQGQEIRIAAAADLNYAMAELAGQFEKETGIKVNVTSGSSGNFFSQIQNGAPFDLFFSADMKYPDKLAATGFAEPETLQYALGRIVVWVPAGAKVDIDKQGWNALLDASVQKIAIANPQLAPYGQAAVSALQKAGIYEQVKGKLIYGENVSQAAQFAQSGNAQAGIIALSLAVSPGMKEGQFWEISHEMYPSIKQGAVVLRIAKDKKAAQTFLDFVKSSAGRAILQKHGFAAPAAKQR